MKKSVKEWNNSAFNEYVHDYVLEQIEDYINPNRGVCYFNKSVCPEKFHNDERYLNEVFFGIDCYNLLDQCLELEGISKMQIDEIRDMLQTIIVEVKGTEVEITYETDLIEDLLMDSVEIFAVVSQVEETIGMEFDDVDLLGENFSCVKNFCLLIQKQLKKRMRNSNKSM